MRDNKLVLGYIGNGKSANRYHIPFVQTRKDKFVIKTVFDIQVRHDLWKEIEGVHYTTDLNELLQDDEIDLIVICTGHQFHYEYAKKVLEANKHCLVEKPFMETSAQAKEIFALAFLCLFSIPLEIFIAMMSADKHFSW